MNGEHSPANEVINAILRGDHHFVLDWARDASGEQIIPLLETARDHDQIDCLHALLNGGPWTIGTHHHVWMRAVELGQTDVAAALLSHIGPNELMEWSLLTAAARGHVGIVLLLMERCNTRDQISAMTQAIHRQQVGVVEVLATTFAKPEYFYYALNLMERAAVANHSEVIDVLYRHWGDMPRLMDEVVRRAKPLMGSGAGHLQQIHHAHLMKQEMQEAVGDGETGERGRRKM